MAKSRWLRIQSVNRVFALTLTVDFVFDARSDLPNCIKVLEELRHKLAPGMRAILGTASPGDDKDVLGLQAADLLAGQLCYNIRNGGTLPPFKRLANCKAIYETPAALPELLEPSLKRLDTLYLMRGAYNDLMRKAKGEKKKQ